MSLTPQALAVMRGVRQPRGTTARQIEAAANQWAFLARKFGGPLPGRR